MPGIGGFILPEEKNPAFKSRNLVKAMQWDASYRPQFFNEAESGCYLTAVSNGVVPMCKLKLNKRYSCVFYGELYPAAENTGPVYIQKVQRFLTGFIKEGSAVLSRADGVFLLAVWDRKDKTLTLANDLFGSFPLNYLYTNEGFIFSSQLLAFKALMPRTETDEIGLAELLLLGMPLNGRTYFKGLRRMLPASLLRWQKGKLSSSVYYHPVYQPQSGRPLKQRLAEISQTFGQAVAQRFVPGERAAAALSGGFDTRAMWSVFLGKSFKAKAVTRGEKKSADIMLAGNIAQKLHLPWRAYYLEELSMENFPLWAEQLSLMSEGFMNMRSALLIPYYRDLASHFDVLFDASGGALLRRQAAWRYGRFGSGSKNPATFTYYLYRKNIIEQGFISAELEQEFKADILADLKNYFGSIASYGQPEDQLDLFYLHQVCSLRTAADLLFQSHFINCRQPFYDRATFDSARTFSISERKKLLIHRSILKNHFPLLANFPLESNDYIIPYQGFRFKRLMPLFSERFVRKLPLLHWKKYPLFTEPYYFNTSFITYLKERLLDEKTTRLPFHNQEKTETFLKKGAYHAGDFSLILHLLNVHLLLERIK